MTLRKCPACKNIVGAESPECPRCGVTIRAVYIRRFMTWTMLAALIAWTICHYALKIV